MTWREVDAEAAPATTKPRRGDDFDYSKPIISQIPLDDLYELERKWRGRRSAPERI
jgi:hypothetical protein